MLLEAAERREADLGHRVVHQADEGARGDLARERSEGSRGGEPHLGDGILRDAHQGERRARVADAPQGVGRRGPHVAFRVVHPIEERHHRVGASAGERLHRVGADGGVAVGESALDRAA